MIRKLLSCSILACFLLAVSVRTHAAPQGQSGQQSEQAKSVTGKVTTVETGGKAFSMEVNQGNSKRTMQFVVDKNTQVQGHVGTGSMATVEYQQNGGQFVAVNVTEQTAPAPAQSQ